MTTSHEAAIAVASAFSGGASLTEDQVDHFFTDVFPGFPEFQRELIFDFILSSTEAVRGEDVAALVASFDPK